MPLSHIDKRAAALSPHPLPVAPPLKLRHTSSRARTYDCKCECVTTAHRISRRAARLADPRPARRTFLRVEGRAGRRTDGGGRTRGRATVTSGAATEFPVVACCLSPFLPRALNSLSRQPAVAGQIASWMDVRVLANSLPSRSLPQICNTN